MLEHHGFIIFPHSGHQNSYSAVTETVDIPVLVKVLIKRMCDRDKAKPCFVTKEAMERLMSYDFPGNVRELLNILQQAMAMYPDGIITVEHIHIDDYHAYDHVRDSAYTTMPAHLIPPARAPAGVEMDAPPSLANAEARYIANLMQCHHHNRQAVAEALGISARTLYRKIKRYQLNSPRNHDEVTSDS